MTDEIRELRVRWQNHRQALLRADYNHADEELARTLHFAENTPIIAGILRRLRSIPLYHEFDSEEWLSGRGFAGAMGAGRTNIGFSLDDTERAVQCLKVLELAARRFAEGQYALFAIGQTTYGGRSAKMIDYARSAIETVFEPFYHYTDAELRGQETLIRPTVEGPRSREKTIRSDYSLHVFVATPRDVAAERNRLALIVRDLNNAFATHGLTLELLDWRDVVPGLGRPEDVILDQLPVEKWDVFIGVLWAHFGTPPGREDPETGKPFLSGTEEEFTVACRSWQETDKPRILFYRCKRPIPPDRLDPEQFALVQKFFDGFKPDGEHPGLPQEYGTVDDFERRVRQDLLKLLLEYSRGEKQATLESEVGAEVRMLQEEQGGREEKTEAVVECETSGDKPVSIPPRASTESPQGEPTTLPEPESLWKKVSLPVWFLIGVILTVVIVLFFVRPLRCLLGYHITEAQVALLALLAGGLAAATFLLPPHIRRALVSFYSGVAVILVLFIIMVWLSSPISVGECSTPTPTLTLAPRLTSSPTPSYIATFTPTLTPTPVRQDDAIYQDGEIVARVSEVVTVEQSQGRILFEEIYDSNSLDIKSEFEFQKWRLMLREYESFAGDTIELISGPDGPSKVHKENVFKNVECEVIGERQ